MILEALYVNICIVPEAYIADLAQTAKNSLWLEIKLLKV